MPDPFAVIDAAGSPSLTPTPSLTTGAVPTADPFEFIDSGGAPADKLTISTRLGVVQDSARAARILRLQARTRLPADILDQNLDEIEQEAARADFDPVAFRASSPRVAAWLAEQPEHMAVAKDDLPLLAGVEQLVRTSSEYAWDKDGAILGPVIRQGDGAQREYYRSTTDLLRAIKERRELAIVDDLIRRQQDDATLDRFGRVGGRIVAGAASSISATQRFLGTADTQSESGKLAASAERNMPGFAGDVVSGVGGVTADIPLILAGGALAPIAALKRFAALGKYGKAALTTALAVQPLAVREGVNVGRDEGWANGLAAWGIETVIPAAFGTTGTEKVLASLAKRGVAPAAARGYAGAAGRLLLDGGMEATEEAVTELAHAIHEVAAGIDPGALDPDRIWRRLGVAAAVGGLVGTGFNLPGALASTGRGSLPRSADREVQRLVQAASGQELLTGILTAAAQSSAAGASPEASRTLFQSLADEQVPQVWLDREAWDQHFTTLGQDPRAKALEIMGDATAYDEAARTGAPLRIETGRLAVDLAKDKPTAEWVAREARLDPTLMNGREAEEHIKAMESVPDDPEAKVQRTAQEAADMVLDEVEQQLTAVGYDAASARRTASQLSSVFRTMAARWNAGRKADDPDRTDARQLFHEWNVSINRPLPEVLASPERQNAELAMAKMRARIADARLEKIDAERRAAQSSADAQLAQEATGEAGFQAILDATARLEQAGGSMTLGDAMRVLGIEYGFRPDATAGTLTPEQARRGLLLATALRARGRSLADLIADAGLAKPDPVATTARGEQAGTDPALERLAADALRLRDIVAAIRGARMTDEEELLLMEQAGALAADVGPSLDQLPLDQATIEDVRDAVAFAQEGPTFNQSMGARVPYGKNATEDALKQLLVADLATVKRKPGLIEKMAAKLRPLNAVPDVAGETEDAFVERFVMQAVRNLLTLHDSVPPEVRERSRLWYDGATKLADEWAAKYGVEKRTVAGVLAVLSPQKDWYQNVDLARRVLDIVTKPERLVWDEAMAERGVPLILESADASLKSGKKDVIADLVEEWKKTNPRKRVTDAIKDQLWQQHRTAALDEVKADMLALRGRAWADLSEVERGRFLRLRDLADNDQSYRLIEPEGAFGAVVTKKDGDNAKVGWAGYANLGKAAAIVESQSIEVISRAIGNEHKVRNFYNNIYDPANAAGFVTIDTHAVAAALLRPLAGADRPVADNFGGVKDADLGISGTYPIYAEAYRLAAAARGLLPREMQSITWEAVRGLFEAGFKSKDNKSAIAEAWAAYARGEQTYESTVATVADMAGGISPPTWYGSRAGRTEVQGDSADAGQVSPGGWPVRAARLGDGGNAAAGDQEAADRGLTLNQGDHETGPRLSSIHNISEENLAAADKLGGLAVPSVAVVPGGRGIRGFGNVVLIGGRSLGDPSKAPVFDADAYTIRFPDPEYGKAKSAPTQKMVDTLKPMAQKFDDYATVTYVWDALVNDGQPMKAVGRMLDSFSAQATFLKEKGVDVEPVMRAKGLFYDFSDTKAMREAVASIDWPKLNELSSQDPAQAEAAKIMGAAAIAGVNEIADAKNLDADDRAYLLEALTKHVVNPETGGMYLASMDKVRRDFNDRLGKKELDTLATREALTNAMRGMEAEYKAWVDNKVMPLAGEPKLTVKGRKVPFTLPNIVEYMTAQRGVKGKEKTMAFGEGAARAAASKQFAELEEMRKAAGDNIVSEEEASAAREKAKKLIEAYREKVVAYYTETDWRGRPDTWAALDASMRAIARWAKGGKTEANMRKALASERFARVPPEIVAEAVAAARAFLTAPVPYFEAKPQRIVDLGEFAAAAIPASATPQSRAILEKHGIKVYQYESDDQIDAAIQKAQSENSDRTLFQRKKRRRGSITFGRREGQRQTDIRLFEGADLSTVLHESGHLYLELLVEMASREGCPQDIKDDLAAALKWMGVEKPEDIGEDQHEQWARGFEAYLMEGKAPSKELRGPFARFAAWLASVYRDVRALAVNLTPEVRGVFDRLLATQEEIDAAADKLGDDPIFADAASSGMTEAEFAAYQKARDEARRTAEEQIRAQAMEEITRERTAAWKDLAKEVRKEVEIEVNRAREYIAAAFLKRGTLPGGVPLPPDATPPFKLDSAEVAKRLDAKYSTRDARNAARVRLIGMHVKSGGIGLDEAARILGYDSGDALLNAMVTLRDRRELIDAETKERMRARFGDILTDGSIAEKAMLAMHNERRADVHLAEVKALATRIGKKTAPIEVMREAARRRIASLSLRDLIPQVYIRAEMKARRQVEQALAKQDFNAAWIAKQQEMLNHELYRAAVEAKAEAEKAVEKLKTYTEKKTRERIGKAGGWEWTVTKPDGTEETYPTEDAARTAAAGGPFEQTSGYLIQIDGLLERYELRRVSAKQLDRRANLAAWIEQQEKLGAPVNIPPEIAKGSRVINYRQVPVKELFGLRDAVANIAHLAKLKTKLSKAQRDAELDQTAAILARTLARTHPNEIVRKKGEKAGIMPRLVALHRKAANMAREMDGDEDAGDWWDALIRPINEAGNAEAVALREADQKQAAIWRTWGEKTKGDGWPAGVRREFDGFEGGLTRLAGIMVALNWGNEANRQRLLEGGGGAKMYDKSGNIINKPLTEAQVQKVLDALSAADWDLVEAIWEHIDSYWSEIAALEQRTTGVAPAKVTPSPFPTKHGIIRGGYFPIMYDGDETGYIDGDATDLAKQIMAQAHGRTQTSRGHTKERTVGQGRAIDLDPGVIGKHLTRVIHDLTHREAVGDALRIILHPNVRAAIDTRMGPATTRALRQWVADIAAGPPTTAGARMVGMLRRGFSMATMGYRTMTAAIQLTGFANAAARVGAGRMTAAIGNLFSTRDDGRAWTFISEKSSMMRERVRTQSRELAETLGSLQGKGAGSIDKAERFQAWVGKYAYWMMQQVQGVVDRATWLAAYDKAQSEGRTDDDSVAIADQAVLDTQGGGQVKDTSGVQRDAYLQVFTGAYTYGAMLFNQLYDQGSRVRRNPKDFGTWVSATGNMMLMTALPAALAVILRGLTRDWWDDKEEKDPFAQRLAVEWGSSLMGTMLGVREMSGALNGFDYGGPAVTRPIGELSNLAGQIGQRELDKGLFHAVANAIGYGLSLPSGQAWATGEGIYQWLEDPSADLRPIIFGPSPGR